MTSNHDDEQIDEVLSHILKGTSPNYIINFNDLNDAVDYESERLHMFNDIRR